MIVVYAVSRNIQTPQNLFDHRYFDNNSKNYLHKKCVEKAPEHHSRRKLQPTYKPTEIYKKI